MEEEEECSPSLNNPEPMHYVAERSGGGLLLWWAVFGREIVQTSSLMKHRKNSYVCNLVQWHVAQRARRAEKSGALSGFVVGKPASKCCVHNKDGQAGRATASTESELLV